jgi:hypothetical protein
MIKEGCPYRKFLAYKGQGIKMLISLNLLQLPIAILLNNFRRSELG